jgi:hypothetical protein
VEDVPARKRRTARRGIDLIKTNGTLARRHVGKKEGKNETGHSPPFPTWFLSIFSERYVRYRKTRYQTNKTFACVNNKENKEKIKRSLSYKKMNSSLTPPVLKPSSLYKEEAKRDATRIRIYNGVLQQIYNKIKAVSRIPGNEKALWYVVPEFLPGVPRFDIGDAILYIVWNLRNAGYFVEYTHPNLLYITWKAHDEKYRETESPWSQVLQSVVTNKSLPEEKYVRPHIVEQPRQIEVKTIDVQKRKTALKKTEEYKPTLTIDAKPNVYSTLYTEPQTTKLPGQLTEKHVSFV